MKRNIRMILLGGIFGVMAMAGSLAFAEIPASNLSPTSQVEATGEASSTAPIQSQVININTASLDELTQIKGIGKKRAQAILAYRQEHGPFQTVDDLSHVKGLGKHVVELNRTRLTVK